ncbi:MAG: K+-dependent Na+/Ca+ exchanger [Actinomycetota bacterium]|jgi:cation:H+ antiporter|nr:MAG: K+-dependent Na+/Ca+ exchanger [Actinomycetota bacterium]
MDIVILLVGFSIGLVLLVKGADEMVSSAVQIALKFKLPSSIIGATFIGFGTSAPELFASTGAALKGDLDLGIGNIVGSNIANSLLVVAVLYLALPKDFSQKIKLNQISPVWMAILTTVFVSTYVLTNEFPFLLGAVLLILVIYVIYKMISTESVDEGELLGEEKNYIWLRGGLSLLATLYGSQLVVDNAVAIAELFGVSSLIIGSTIIAIGTSLPEVAGTISAAKMRKPDIVFGNIFGSNLFNIGLVGATAIMISPGEISSVIDYQLFIMYFVSFIVIFLSRNLIKRNTLLGYLFIVAYILFLVSLF